jgi:hypothetical protein
LASADAVLLAADDALASATMKLINKEQTEEVAVS